MPRKRRGRKKSVSQFRHCCRRAWERFNLRITENDIHEIRALIISGQALMLHRQSLRVAHYRIEYREADMIVVYDKTRKMVVTFLEPDKYDWDRWENENKNVFQT